MQHYKEEKREENKTEAGEEIEMTKMKPIADFLKDINYEDVDSSLGIQLNQMLRKYTLRKTRLEQREKEVSAIYKYKIKYSRYYCNSIMDFFIQWKVIYNEKPDISVNYTHDVFAIEEAKRTIGDYKLKTSSPSKLLPEEQDTLFSKYKELLNCRKKVGRLKKSIIYSWLYDSLFTILEVLSFTKDFR